ncbi:hypothetical protein NOVO_05170 [Rickettsiales bacterium Ac37b]|nr:hypothetical protein NOVO_05170 [Rickettsiales bacterium Ac37b]
MEQDCINIVNTKYASHLELDFDHNIVQATEKRLRASHNLALPLEEEISLLQEIIGFELGRFLLQNKGLNGYWTQYVILGDHSNLNQNSLEYWVFNKAPAVLATQERFSIFKQKTNEILKSNMTLASIPCGLMDDLLSLDYTGKENIKLVGIDLDPLSLKQAEENSLTYNKNVNVSFKLENAWNLSSSEEYDLITSNGLNIYEPNDTKVIELYKKLYNALSKDGYLITSFLTLPPTLTPDSPWKNFSMHDVIKQKAIFVDILQAKWQTFRTEEQIRYQLEQVGFRILEIIYDKQSMFPTVIAQK